ncbi:MAG: biliverdin-producing heme oxygenase [Flavobacteriales bacterium]
MELIPLDALRQATATAHQELEKDLFGDRIRSGTLTAKELNVLLAVNHHFLEAVERNALRHPSLVEFVAPRAQLACDDLHAMGCATLPSGTALDAASDSEMRGALYVALGSSLGVTMIGNLLKRMPQFHGRTPSFFTSDPDALTRWRVFSQDLGRPTVGVVVSRIVDGALRTFAMARHGLAQMTNETVQP